MENIEVRNDDILLVTPDTQWMKYAFSRANFYEKFLEVDKLFAEHNIIQRLSILAEGIDVYPEWVEYIKNNKHRFKIEMHGWGHVNYRIYNKDFAYNLLKTAKEKIENTFETKIDRWYVPHGRSCFPDWGKEVCDKLEIKFHTTGGKVRHEYYHYWNLVSVDKIYKILEENKWQAMYDNN